MDSTILDEYDKFLQSNKKSAAPDINNNILNEYDAFLASTKPKPKGFISRVIDEIKGSEDRGKVKNNDSGNFITNSNLYKGAKRSVEKTLEGVGGLLANAFGNDDVAQSVNKYISDNEANYQKDTDGSIAAGVGNVLGTVLQPAPIFGRLATVGSKLLPNAPKVVQGVGNVLGVGTAGAGAGALSPNYNTVSQDDYLSQAKDNAVLGAIAAPVVKLGVDATSKLGRGGVGLIRRYKDSKDINNVKPEFQERIKQAKDVGIDNPTLAMITGDNKYLTKQDKEVVDKTVNKFKETQQKLINDLDRKQFRDLDIVRFNAEKGNIDAINILRRLESSPDINTQIQLDLDIKKLIKDTKLSDKINTISNKATYRVQNLKYDDISDITKQADIGNANALDVVKKLKEANSASDFKALDNAVSQYRANKTLLDDILNVQNKVTQDFNNSTYKFIGEVQKAADKGDTIALDLQKQINNVSNEPDNVAKLSILLRVFKERKIKDELYNKASSLVDKTQQLDLKDTIKTIDTIKKTIDPEFTSNQPTIRYLNELKGRLNNKAKEVDIGGATISFDKLPKNDYTSINNLRKQLGEDISQQYKGGDSITGNVKAAKLQPIKEELTKALRVYADTNPKAAEAFNKADKNYKENYAPRFKDDMSLVNAIVDNNPRKIVDLLQSKDAKRYIDLLDDKGKAAVRAIYLNQALEKTTNANGEINFRMLANELHKPNIREIYSKDYINGLVKKLVSPLPEIKASNKTIESSKLDDFNRILDKHTNLGKINYNGMLFDLNKNKDFNPREATSLINDLRKAKRQELDINNIFSKYEQTSDKAQESLSSKGKAAVRASYLNDAIDKATKGDILDLSALKNNLISNRALRKNYSTKDIEGGIRLLDVVANLQTKAKQETSKTDAFSTLIDIVQYSKTYILGKTAKYLFNSPQGKQFLFTASRVPKDSPELQELAINVIRSATKGIVKSAQNIDGSNNPILTE